MALVVGLALMAAATSPARAQGADPNYWKLTAETKDTVSRFIYSQSPQTIPSGYNPVAEAEEYLRQAQRTLPPSNPQAQTFWQQLRDVPGRVGLSPATRALGTIGLAAGTFDLGWKIGTGINAKFLRLGLPDPPEPKTSPKAGTLVYKNAGYTSSFNGTPLPADGWLLKWFYSGQSWTSVNLSGGWSSNCAYLTGPPSGFRVLSGYASVGWCIAPPVPVESYWLVENELAAPGPIEDYTSQSFTRSTAAPIPPSQSTVEDSIEDELDKPEANLLRQWLNYMLGSPSEEDPLGIGDPNPDIEFPGWFEHWEEHGDEFAVPYEDPIEYWWDAADIIERKENGDTDILKCERPSDKASIYWDPDKEAIVIVKDGKIVTYFPPDDGFNYWLNECGN